MNEANADTAAVGDVDPRVYFRVVAQTLLRNHGRRSFHYAEQALEKMRRKGDEEGFALWRGVHEQLVLAWRAQSKPRESALH